MLNSLYSYPVELTVEEVKDATAIDITTETRPLFVMAHSYVYDILIYPTFNADIKSRIIEKYKSKLELPLKRAILEQFVYMMENGDVGDWNGFLQGNSNTVDSKDQQDILTKMIAPKVINTLKAAPIDILYAGG